MAETAAKKKEWNSCLAKFGGNLGRCSADQKALEAAAKTDSCDSCVDETIKLMKCTQGSSRSDGCAAQFLAMRECNRAGGRHLQQDGKAWAPAARAGGLFEANGAALAQSTPPARNLEGMVAFGTDYAASLGIAPGKVAF